MKHLSIHHIIIFLLFPLTAALLIPYFQYELNPDLISYLSIAEKYQSGNIKDAVNGYWPPLFSWLIIPLLSLKITPIIAGKILGIITGMVVLLSLRNICKQFYVSQIAVSFLLVVTGCLMLPFIFIMTNPDLLMASILLWYINFLFSLAYKERTIYGILCGTLGALAYLCKYFGFFFFLTHFTLITFIFYQSEKNTKRIILRNYINGISVFLCISVLWIAALSFKYGELTISTSAKYNFALIGPHADNHKILSGFHAPSNTSATSAWEDPTHLHWEVWSPFSSTENFIFYMKRLFFNLHTLFLYLKEFSPLVFLIIPVSLFLIIKERKINGLLNNPMSWLLLTIAIYSFGYGLVLFESRYLWPVYFLLLILLVMIIDIFFSKIQLSKPAKYILLSALTFVLIFNPLKYLCQNINIDKNTAVIANEIKTRFKIKGTIASDTGWSWFNSLFLCYHLKCPYYGAATKDISKDQLIKDLKKYKIDYYFDWGKRDFILDDNKELTGGSIPELRIYKISD